MTGQSVIGSVAAVGPRPATRRCASALPGLPFAYEALWSGANLGKHTSALECVGGTGPPLPHPAHDTVPQHVEFRPR